MIPLQPYDGSCRTKSSQSSHRITEHENNIRKEITYTKTQKFESSKLYDFIKNLSLGQKSPFTLSSHEHLYKLGRNQKSLFGHVSYNIEIQQNI